MEWNSNEWMTKRRNLQEEARSTPGKWLDFPRLFLDWDQILRSFEAEEYVTWINCVIAKDYSHPAVTVWHTSPEMLESISKTWTGFRFRADEEQILFCYLEDEKG